MTENEFILQDRLNVIRDTINKYGIDNFYLSFSGGKDSTILHHLLDMTFPNNEIPRVFTDTGIEYTMISKFVKKLAETDKRIVIIKPTLSIKETLETYGYPFKSKEHSQKVEEYQLHHIIHPYMERYVYGLNKDGSVNNFKCPNKLLYQFEKHENELKISKQCCSKLKKEPSKKWAKENNKTITITGMRSEEGGTRLQIGCMSKKQDKFHPLSKVNDEWEDWFVKEYNIQLCELYYPPYNFKRTGCKGCPYALDLQHNLDVMQELLPIEKAQCEYIWQPVYAEYRRLNYRLRNEENIKLF